MLGAVEPSVGSRSITPHAVEEDPRCSFGRGGDMNLTIPDDYQNTLRDSPVFRQSGRRP